MMQANFDDNKIRELCAKHGIKLLILHGSCAKGTATAKSDIDVGVLCGRKVSFDAYGKILSDFIDVFGDSFDPVFLNGAESMIAYRTAMTGRPLFEAQKGIFAEYRMQALGSYLDARKFREMEKEYVRRAAKG